MFNEGDKVLIDKKYPGTVHGTYNDLRVILLDNEHGIWGNYENSEPQIPGNVFIRLHLVHPSNLTLVNAEA